MVIMDAVKAAIAAGASAIDLGRSVAYAAALRLARFGSSNEHTDWETAHHVFTYEACWRVPACRGCFRCGNATPGRWRTT
jgi:hypothetical protein